ncbi:MAG TPA: inverse autotransporter beta domain-containing protein, partial [Candidatus Bathyarchaeia archaeon]|nr:inverse autotransporter beta domain-containing protein [Candidatus Bathyarchaeia archaeon]
MKKIVVCWGLGVLCLAFSSFSFAAIEGEGGNVPEYMKVFQKSSPADPNKNPFQDFEMPDWAKRFWFGGSYGTDTAESIYLETVQPLYWAGDGKGVIFTHDRISKFDEHGSYSAGLGYRKIVDRLHAIAGVNAFLDYQSHLNHARLGYGVELIGNRLEFRTNFYTGLTGQRDTGLGTGSVTYFQEVVDGFDTEIGTPVPYLPWMKIFGGYQWYDYKHRGDFCGWTSRLEMTLKKAAVLNLNIFDDEDHGDVGVEVDLRFRLVFEDMKSLLTLNDVEWMSSTPKTEINLEDRLLDRVEREFEIRVESWKEGESSGGVSVGNLTNVVLQVNRLPGTSMTGGLDADNIGYADAGDGFEIDF